MNKIKGFDGLRALSVMMVIFSHAVIWPRIGVTSAGIKAVFSAHYGVSVFFALSGFLITYLLLREKESTGKTDLFAFFMRRVLRIFPLYFLAVTLVLFMDYFERAKVQNCAYLYAYTYTLNFIPKACNFNSLSHFWSLAVEEHFYLAWPLIFMLGRKFAIAAAMAFAAACLYFGVSLFDSGTTHYLARWTFPAAAPIAFGCLCAFVCDNDFVKRAMTDRHGYGIILVAILTGLAAPAFYRSELVWLVSISALLLYIYHNQDSLLVRFLEIKPLVALGVISYGLYVWQGVFTGNGPYRANSLPFPPSVETGLWLTFIAAPISYLYFERPILSLKRRFSWKEKQ